MTKAWLSRQGVPFEELDVESDPEAMAELRSRGLRSTPAVVIGDRAMTGWNPGQLAALVGIAYEERTGTPEQLLSTIRTILEASLRAVRQVPDDRLALRSPDRDRPLRELAHHIFRVIEVSVDADVLGIFPANTWLAPGDVPAHDSAERIARFGETVKAKFDGWYRGTESDPARFTRTIDADVGPRTLAQVLERTRLHAGQHLRQLYVFLSWCSVEPEVPLSLQELRRMGLDLPDETF
ncbi:MAG: hypothetical protein M3470_03725 [Chloroflexota bacterium]|nr:hypothetical protein [Chloroflexota bacterium]